MSHSLDFVGLDKKLFFLRHLIAGNKEFSRREKQYQGTKSDRNEDWDHYAQRLRYIVSNELIEIAAKLRVIQDTAMSQVSADDLRDLDVECIGNSGIGTVLVGNFALTLRESCNKIIHANTFELIFQNARSTVPIYVYTHWNGICQLAGTHSKKQWKIALDVYRWSDAMDYFLQELAGNVDW
jgi:hypothetical protein